MDTPTLADYYRDHNAGLVRYLNNRPNVTPILADDIAATTWERIITADYDPQLGAFTTWLYAIARNVLAEHWRTINRRPETLDGNMASHDAIDASEQPDEAIIRKWDRERLQTATETLESPLQRQVVVLRFYDGLSVAETAQRMGRTLNAVKQLQARGLRNIARRVTTERAS